MFCKKDFLKNFAKFTGKHLCLGLLFNEVAELKLGLSSFILRMFGKRHSTGSGVNAAFVVGFQATLQKKLMTYFFIKANYSIILLHE